MSGEPAASGGAKGRRGRRRREGRGFGGSALRASCDTLHDVVGGPARPPVRRVTRKGRKGNQNSRPELFYFWGWKGFFGQPRRRAGQRGGATGAAWGARVEAPGMRTEVRFLSREIRRRGVQKPEDKFLFTLPHYVDNFGAKQPLLSTNRHCR